VLAKTLSDRASQLAVQRAGGTGTVTVVPDLTVGGPVLLVTVTNRTPAAALRTLAAATAVVPGTLARLQTTSGVPASLLIRAKEITRDTVAQPVRKSQLRAMLAAAAAGLGGTMLLTALFDGYLTRRSARRKGGPDAAAPAPAAPVPATPVEVRRPVTGEPMLWQPHHSAAGTAPGVTPVGASSAAGRLPPGADPDATMELRNLEAAADLLGTPSELRPGRTGSHRAEVGWGRHDAAG
jgi:hypothetical protein